MSEETLLIGWMKNRTDLRYFEEAQWYRIPTDVAVAAPERWRVPNWIALMESTSISRRGQQIVRFARVIDVRVRSRQELLGSVAPGPKQERTYYQLLLEPARRLPAPLMPMRRRRGPSFIWTTLDRFIAASEFNDLFDDSPAENDLWARMKQTGISAERQWPEFVDHHSYYLDFAVFCRDRNIDVEVDGLQHHLISSNSIYDAERDRSLTRKGWAVHRILAKDLMDEPQKVVLELCETIETYGGLTESRMNFITSGAEMVSQLRLMSD